MVWNCVIFFKMMGVYRSCYIQMHAWYWSRDVLVSGFEFIQNSTIRQCCTTTLALYRFRAPPYHHVYIPYICSRRWWAVQSSQLGHRVAISAVRLPRRPPLRTRPVVLRANWLSLGSDVLAALCLYYFLHFWTSVWWKPGPGPTLAFHRDLWTIHLILRLLPKWDKSYTQTSVPRIHCISLL